MAVSIVRTQSTKRLALAVGTCRDDVADLDGAFSDDHAVNQQFEQRPLLVEVGACQALAHTAAERLGMGCQASRLALAFGITREFESLPVQRLQPCLGVAPASFVFGQGHDAGQIGVREPPGRGAGWLGALAAPAATSGRRAPAPSRARSSQARRSPRTGRAKPGRPGRKLGWFCQASRLRGQVG